MKKPKTIKRLLLLLIEISDSVPSDYNGGDKLTSDEYMALGEILAAMQNRLGDDLSDLLKRHSLEWKG